MCWPKCGSRPIVWANVGAKNLSPLHNDHGDDTDPEVAESRRGTVRLRRMPLPRTLCHIRRFPDAAWCARRVGSGSR